MDIEEVVQEYLATLKRLRPLTRKGYEQRLSVFCAWIAEENKEKANHHLKKITLETLNSSVVSAFVEHLRETHRSHKAGGDISTHTLAGYVRCILCFLHWCVEDEEYSRYVKELVIRRIKLPKTVQTIIEVFTDDQVDALRKACKQERDWKLRLRDECILAVLLGTGIRAFELCTLTIEHTHLDPRESYIKVYGKGAKWREVPVDDKTRRLLKRYKQYDRQDAKPGERFFLGRTRQPLTVNGLEKLMNRLGSAAEISGVRCSPHTCRHTFAVRFMQTISDIYLLSKIMGHNSVRTTEEYLKSFSGKEVRLSLLKKMNEL